MRLTLACGGHPPPLVRRASGEITTVETCGPLLGAFGDASFPEAMLELGPGDTVLVYTDGLIERNPRVRDAEGLRRLLATLPAGDVGELLAELERRALGSPPDPLPDDAAVLAIQVTGSTADGEGPDASELGGGLAASTPHPRAGHPSAPDSRAPQPRAPQPSARQPRVHSRARQPRAPQPSARQPRVHSRAHQPGALGE